jgi:hypothetical protein
MSVIFAFNWLTLGRGRGKLPVSLSRDIAQDISKKRAPRRMKYDLAMQDATIMLIGNIQRMAKLILTQETFTHQFAD